MQRNVNLCKSDGSRQALSNEYLVATIGLDTAENEPFNFHHFSSLQGFNFHRAVVSDKVHVITGASYIGATGQICYGPDEYGDVLLRKDDEFYGPIRTEWVHTRVVYTDVGPNFFHNYI